jgi:hypothetical protein
MCCVRMFKLFIMAGAIYLPSDVFPRDTELSVIC